MRPSAWLVAAMVLVAVPLAWADADKPDHAGAAKTPAPPPEAPATGAAVSEGEAEEPSPTPSAVPVPKPPQGTPKVPAVVKDGMVRIPGGRFVMGSSDRNAPPNERPARGAEVPPFWIDRTEVSVGAYRACVDRGACTRPANASTTCTYDLGDADLPVSCVSWSAAQTFCAAAGKRLPREPEWELAARGTLGYRYPWGNAYAGCGAAVTLVKDGSQRSCGKRPAKVGSRLGGASPFGVLDMSGNVEEWVADWYAETAAELSPLAGASHVLRGGGWLSPPSLSRATTRNWGSVREAGPNVGFRCARDDGREP